MNPPISLTALLPELLLLVGGCTALLLGQARRDAIRTLVPWVSLAALVLGVLAVLFESRLETLLGPAQREGNGLVLGALTPFVRLSALELGILIVLVNWSLGRASERGEVLALLLFSLTGLLLVGSADNLFVLFLALELVSIPLYVVVVLSGTGDRAAEAGTKYFYLGALTAALMAYGFALLYGAGGSASLRDLAEPIRAALAQPGTLPHALAVAGLLLGLVGVLFKIGAVPLHFYIADVYQGAASEVAGLLGFVPKLAGLIAIFRLVGLTGLWEGLAADSYWIVWLIAAATMTVGNVLALRQTNIKRMLAYSGVAHSGYMLVGLLAGPSAGRAVIPGGFDMLGDGTAAVLFYAVVYGIANLAAFGVLGLLRARGGACETLRDAAGLLRREPGAALLLALAMLSLLGLPPTPGFWGKFSLFGSALAAARAEDPARGTWTIVLVVLAVLNSAVSAAYYLRVVAAVLLYESDRPAYALRREAQSSGTLLCGLLLLIFAFYPAGLLGAAQRATRDLSVTAMPAAARAAHEAALPPGPSVPRSLTPF